MPAGPYLDAWEIDEGAYPQSGTEEQRFRFLLRYAMLAPSSHNAQPWSWVINGNTLELYADRRRALPVADPQDRELIISCGAALYHLRLAMRRFGSRERMALFPRADDRDLLAYIQFGSAHQPSEDELALFGAITKRHTNRMPFEEKPLAPKLLSLLQATAHIEGAWLISISDNNTRRRIASMIAQGNHAQQSDKDFRKELAAWVRPNVSPAHDGVPGYAQGYDNFSSLLGPLSVRLFDNSRTQSAKDQQYALEAPALMLLGTDGDSVRDWLAAGQAVAKVLLRCTANGICVSFLNQPVQVHMLRLKLQDMMTRLGFPQLLLRLGCGSEVKPTPRRNVDEVLE